MENKDTFLRKDFVFALIMLISGFLYCNLIHLDSLGAGVTIFAAIFCLSVFFYLRAGGIQQTRRSILCLIIVVLSSLVFLLFDNMLIKGLNFLFLTFTVIYWISLSTGRTLENKLSAYILGDFFNQVIIIPFSNFACCFSALKSMTTGNKKGKSLLAVVVGILVMIPVLAAVIALLSKADAAFAEVIANLNFNISMEIIIQIILGIPVACYLFGLIYGDLFGRNTETVTVASVDKLSASARFVPEVTGYTALTLLNLVYIAFFLSQLAYLFSAFNNHLPELMTYAEYARRGFFELCAVAAINLIVLTAVYLLIKRGRERVLKIETVVLCLFTLLLIVTAISKMVMYINCFGMTPLRIYTTWFMLVLFLIFAVITLRQFKKFNAARTMLAGFVILFLALSYGNVDGRIAAYNIDRYQSGALKSLDVQALAGLSAAAKPYLYSLYTETTDPKLKAELCKALSPQAGDSNGESDMNDFRDFNLQRHLPTYPISLR
ncbi:DUF4173 domain-containing protein [Dehalobacter sp. DCM]|uniref:DUF4153 domain-containing protein n=1 Tax=Dehalobacter sp. DCM TaxID=2907827 RepID=UPI0030818FBF|nr:DUF4173 domain-containing protein [Dehalobacter sp. DCM]